MMPDAPTLVLLVIIGLLALSLMAVSATLAFHSRAQRLPAATRLEDVRERLAIAEQKLDDRRQELKETEKAIHERDRYAAEAEVLKQQIDTLRLEQGNLDAARMEIEQVKREAAAAAGEKAGLDQELKSLREDEARLRTLLDPERVARLKEDVDGLLRERDRIATEVGNASSELDAALRTITESRSLEARIAVLKAQCETSETSLTSLQARREELEDAVDTARAGCAQAQSEADAARQQRDAARKQDEQLRAELAGLSAEIDRLQLLAETLKSKRDELEEAIDTARAARSQSMMEAEAAGRQRDEARKDVEHLRLQQAGLSAEVETLKTLSRTLQDELELRGMAGPDAGKPPSEADKKAMLQDLVAEPACLASPATLRGSPRLETEALHDVENSLRDSGLTFHRRTVRAFHTALKVNDTAQLTVLAGVSGTGKSLLPRRYAEAMGIHFLQVAVEPRWDSPQDLLGFYNYVEKRYRATDLSRLLVHMDPWQSHDLPQGTVDRRDHMAMVLLDEMNLARVEYYFSEFLSRLEARPGWDPSLSQADGKERAKDAMIPVDIRGLDNPPKLFPAHNVLFVGTMNDDESTQSLSDKVLDRGNVLQFPAPLSFPSGTQKGSAISGEAQRFSEWRGWINPGRAAELPNAVGEAIGDLARIMQEFGKPFGHRLNQSMRAYVAQYPREGNAGLDVKTPLADQVEFRILPKLRGVEIANHQGAFDDLDRLVRGSLIDDAALAEKIAETVRAQEGTTGLFVWRGMSRRQ